MHKKLITVCMAIVGFAAFIVPSAASGSPTLTHEGNLFPTHPLNKQCIEDNEGCITARSTGETSLTGGFNVSCSKGDLAGWVIENTGVKLRMRFPAGGAKFSGTGTSSDCTSALGSVNFTVTSELCLETVTGTDNMVITGCTGNVVLTLDVTGTVSCKYSTASITGTFKTSAGASLNVSEQAVKKSEGGFLCPAEGKLDMSDDFYTWQTAEPQLVIS